MKRNNTALIAAVVCFALTGSALAATKSTVVDARYSEKSETVSFADLNINTAEGLETLHHRIEAAAERVCFVRDGVLTLPARIERQECLEETMSRAVNKIGMQNMVGLITN